MVICLTCGSDSHLQRIEAETFENFEGRLPERMGIALKILRAWSGFHGSYAFSADVIIILYTWIDNGMKGSIPWPDDPFFAKWADNQGLVKVGGSVDWRETVKSVLEEGAAE